MDKKFIEAVEALPLDIAELLKKVPHEIQVKAREICLRAQRPLVLSTFGGNFFIKKDGQPSSFLTNDANIITKQKLDECISFLTEYSLHSYKDKINMGFITINGGHRAGVVGSCVLNQDKILTITDFSSINLRISRQIKGVSHSLVRQLYHNGVCSTLIVGPPASGKTTLIRDIAYNLSSGLTAQSNQKISIIDERGEIAAMKNGVPQNDVGIFCDVLDSYKKGDGMLIAIRTMTPKAIILDEIGGYDDAQAIRQGLNAGVDVIATVHASSIKELTQKANVAQLIKEGAFKKIVLLSGAEKPCTILKVIDYESIIEEVERSFANA